MNSEAQRARNKRKRDKAREKRRISRRGSILRFRIDGVGYRFQCACGLEYPHPTCNPEMCAIRAEKLGVSRYSYNPVNWSTEWVYMGTHELSTSARDAIMCFHNTYREMWYTYIEKVSLTLQCNGTERRYVWRGHTPGARSVGRLVCSFARNQLLSE